MVVLSIIGVLLALLVPALKRVSELVGATECKDNMRQMSSALHIYSGDNNGYFPPVTGRFFPFTWHGSTPPGTVYIPWYSSYYAGQYIGNTNLCSTAFGDQVPTTNALICPTGKANYTGSNAERKTFIGYNNSDWPFPLFSTTIKEDGSLAKEYVPVHVASNPEKLLVLIDTPSSYAWGNVKETSISYRHSNKVNFLLMDGHVADSEDLESDVKVDQIYDVAMER